MKQIIDIETWERRDNYNFFRNFGIPLLVPYTKDFGRITQF